MQETQKNPEAVEKRITTASPFTRLAADLVTPTTEPKCVSTQASRHAGADDMLDFAMAERRRQQLDRIEAKVDMCAGMLRDLVCALAEEDEAVEKPQTTLDGVADGGERDQSQSLG